VTVFCCLVSNATEAGWFATRVGAASQICCPESRIRFISPDGKPSGAPLQGQAVVYGGSNGQGFADRFSKFGFICEVTCG